ncbi:MAG: twin-arginine translocase TatA/TatE family subunit [Proteobacteria bacterium]|nr:twin-arginine translocase TatA/TatE family subunit [Pseudomonadota bacterium]
MFGLGIPEIICILVIAVIVLGPEHMPKAAQMIGKWSAKLRSAATSFEQAIVQDEDLREIKTNLSEVKSEIDKAKSDLFSIRDDVAQVPNDISQAYQEAKDEMQNIQGVVGRQPLTKTSQDPQSDASSNPLNEEKQTAPEPSPFLSRPLQWFDSPEPKASNAQSIKLDPPKLLPGPIARQVYRKPYALDLPKNPAQFRAVSLSAPQKDAAFCRIRRIHQPKAGIPGTLHTVPLKRHE